MCVCVCGGGLLKKELGCCCVFVIESKREITWWNIKQDARLWTCQMHSLRAGHKERCEE